MNPVEIYTVATAHLFAVVAIVYPLVYRTSPWKSGATGKALMNMARSVALLFFIAVLRFWWPFPGHEYAYAAALTYMGLAMTYQLLVMYRLRRRARAREAATDARLRALHRYTQRTEA